MLAKKAYILFIIELYFDDYFRHFDTDRRAMLAHSAFSKHSPHIFPIIEKCAFNYFETPFLLLLLRYFKIIFSIRLMPFI